MTVDPIDLQFQGIPGIIAGWLLRSGDACALIETGPASCHAALIAGLAAHGVSPADIKQVFLTHIHLDHAGGAGWWGQQGAQIYVHAKGAAHVVDPGKLIESASRIYGDQMKTLWGEILPAPAKRVTVLNDRDRVKVGNVDIEAWDTPGHARHHLAFIAGDVCFTGDVAGVRLQGCDYLSVAAAPPQFEPEPYVASVIRLQAANFSRLCLAHFGDVRDPADHLRRYARRIEEVHQFIRARKQEGLVGADLAQAYTQAEHLIALSQSVSEADWLRYEFANGTTMCAAGIELFVSKNPG